MRPKGGGRRGVGGRREGGRTVALQSVVLVAQFCIH